MLARKSQDMFWFSPHDFFFKHVTGFSVGFRNTRILTPVSQKSKQQFFSRQSHRFSGDVNSIENHLWVDLQSGLLMKFGSSARTQSWNGGSGASGKRGHGSGSRTRSVVIQWEAYHGPKKEAWKLGQYQKITQRQL